ncbi:MAG: hypothetical protein LBM95_09550 [Lactobacillales bacterium]|jgi:hypothetical protein|nr:hypothetical protein [Lactobacillales bacterium]
MSQNIHFNFTFERDFNQSTILVMFQVGQRFLTKEGKLKKTMEKKVMLAFQETLGKVENYILLDTFSLMDFAVLMDEFESEIIENVEQDDFELLGIRTNLAVNSATYPEVLGTESGIYGDASEELGELLICAEEEEDKKSFELAKNELIDVITQLEAEEKQGLPDNIIDFNHFKK